IAREPAARRRIVRTQERAAGLGDAQEAGYRHRSRDIARRPRLGIVPPLGHETAIDEQRKARRFERRHHPIARAALGHRLHQRFTIVPEPPRGGDAPIGVVLRIDRIPSIRPRYRDGLGLDARIDRGDQFVLPRAPLDLPDAERRKAERRDQRRRGKNRAAGPSQSTWLVGSCGIGIILVLRWCITHSEPASMIPTTMIVKTSEVSDQPPSAFGVMWRKKIMWTTICTTAKPMMIAPVAAALSGIVITSQKGMAVRITDRTKPIT